MTKEELIKALEPFDDDQYVFVLLHNDDYPDGAQVIIQGVRAVEPWHPEHAKPLIGIVAHSQNKELGTGIDPDPENKSLQRRFSRLLKNVRDNLLKDGEQT